MILKSYRYGKKHSTQCLQSGKLTNILKEISLESYCRQKQHINMFSTIILEYPEEDLEVRQTTA